MASKEPRIWSIDEIQPLPKRLYRKVYGQDYSGDWKLRFSGLSDGEKNTLMPILNRQKFKEVYWVPEVNLPKGIMSSDLYIDGRRVEIKSVTTANSINLQLRKSAKQVGDDGWVIIDSSKSKLKLSEIRAAADIRGVRSNITKYAIMSDGKLKDVRSISKGKSSRPSTKRVNEGEPASYVSTLARNSKNVNLIKNSESDSYWERRSLERLSDAEKLSISYLKQVQKEYRSTAKAVVEQVRDLYANYYRKSGEFDIAALNQIAPQGDVRRFLADMKAKGLPTDLPANYRGRMSRLELLNYQMQGKIKEMATKEKVATTDLYDKVFRGTYYRTGYDTSKGLGETLAFGTLNEKTVERVLNTKFYGKNYSERIWGNDDKLGARLQSIISQAIAIGQSPEKTIRLVRERFSVSESNAARLVRTETCYFENQAELEAYNEMGITEFVVLATLDSRTSKICREMDGKRFKVKDAIAGENVPPLHPYCRSTIRPYISDDFEPTTRIMRDSETGKNKSIDNISYNEWQAQCSQNGPKEGVLVRLAKPRIGEIEPVGTDFASLGNRRSLNNELQIYSNKIFQSLSDEEKMAIEDYTDAWSAELNMSLSSNRPLLQDSATKEQLLSGVLERSSLGRNAIVYSGVSYPDGFVGRNADIGEIFTSRVYVSASLKRSIADEFAGYGLDECGYEIFLEIRIPVRAKALYLGENSWSGNHGMELIINKDTKFKVLDKIVHTKGKYAGRTVLKLEILP